MRTKIFSLLTLLTAALLFPGTMPGHATGKRLLTVEEARQLALLAAKHDRIDVSDAHVEINSMDLNAEFIRGFASFIVLRESSTPGPDETLRKYAISRRSGNVWEITLCTRYSFPELTRAQHSLTGKTADEDMSGIAAEQKNLGCKTGEANTL